MSVLTATFDRLKHEGCMVDLYRDHLSGESLTGVITDVSEAFVYLSLFSEAGLPNGVAVCFLQDVTRVRWEGNERASIEALVKKSGSKPTAPELQLKSIKTVISLISSTFGYVNILTERINGDISFIGEVMKFDKDALLLKTFGTYSTRDRSSLIIRTNEITRVDADAAYERSVVFLAAGKAN